MSIGSPEVIRLPRVQRFGLVGLLAVLSVAALSEAARDFEVNQFDGAVSLGLGAALLALAFRVLAVRVQVDASWIRVEGILRGALIERSHDLQVVPERRLFGWEGLAIRSRSSGERWRLPLSMTSSDHKTTRLIQSQLEALLGGQGSATT
jgi:hypothetical protein